VGVKEERREEGAKAEVRVRDVKRMARADVNVLIVLMWMCSLR
jgi:hypothetical protein